MEDLYLPPRRKNMQQNNADNSEYSRLFLHPIYNAFLNLFKCQSYLVMQSILPLAVLNNLPLMIRAEFYKLSFCTLCNYSIF